MPIRVFHQYTDNDIDFHIWVDKFSDFHGHDYYEFAICNKGQIIHSLNDEAPVVIKKKQAFFITPDDAHSIEAVGGATHINVGFVPKLYLEMCRYFDFPAGRFQNRVITLTDEEFLLLTRQIHKVLQISHGENSEKYLNSLRFLVTELFYYFLLREGEIKVAPDWLQEFADKICTAEYFGVAASELYKLSNYSQPVVTAAFKKYYGKSFVQYLTEAKMLYACGMLKNTNISILDISNQLGFSSLSHFNSVFKKLMGDTPSHFRKK